MSGSLLDQRVGPEDLAFCLALPLSRKDFERSAQEQFDFVPNWLRSLSGRNDPLEFAWHAYTRERLPDELRRLCDVLAGRGVRVEAPVDWQQLGSCMRERRVVILMAHFANTPIEPSCIANPHHLLAMVDHEEHWILDEVRHALRGRLWWSLVARGEQDLRRTIAFRLNRLVERGRGGRGAAGAKPARRRRAISRLLLEYALMPALAAARPLELADGMFSAWDLLEQVIPHEREVIVDMTSCNAAEMGEVVRLVRRGCRVIAPRGTIRVQAGILLVRTITELLTAGERTYVEAHFEALDAIRDVITRGHEP